MTISMTYQEIEDKLNEITLGQKFVTIKGKVFVLRYPSQEDLFESRIVHDLALEEAKANNLPSVDEMENIIKTRNIFSEKDESKVQELQEKIEGQKKVLDKTVRVPARRERLIEIIKGLESQIREIRRKKDVLLEGTREAKAREAQYLFLLRKNCLSYPGFNLLWDSEKSFGEEKDFVLRVKLYYEYIGVINGIDTPTIRFLARTTLFKIRYQNALKASAPLFDRPVFNYTVDMLNLSYWGYFYNSLYEMMPEDVPPDYVIQDDEALDAHMEAIYKERSQERAEMRSRSSGRDGLKSAWNHSEVIVTKSNPLYQDIDYDGRKKGKDGGTSSVDVKKKADERQLKGVG